VRKARTKRTSCRPANDTLVAIIRVGVGPGVKIEDMRSVRKAAMMTGARFDRGKAQKYQSRIEENLGSTLSG